MLKLQYKVKGETKYTSVDNVKGFRSGYAHLHYFNEEGFEYCIPYSSIDSFKVEGKIDEALQSRTEPSISEDPLR